MTKVEEVARAICEQEEPDGLGNWQNYTPHARAAIEVMRVPTRAMLEAGAVESGEDSEACALGAWEGMIDAALKEETP